MDCVAGGGIGFPEVKGLKSDCRVCAEPDGVAYSDTVGAGLRTNSLAASRSLILVYASRGRVAKSAGKYFVVFVDGEETSVLRSLDASALLPVAGEAMCTSLWIAGDVSEA